MKKPVILVNPTSVEIEFFGPETEINGFKQTVRTRVNQPVFPHNMMRRELT
ncbi:hypothetical protein HNQ94_002840 [Salirhabdus euzebyi]|uniref:Uncharacterized protein n=1 Tax=Salirhabdus euzebyi TaxID=394506 RepID=A0A841Q7K8_9BACI|nr:hypothetical protein [Salirhabdus euzebyi]MBB6454365.1 hypothetical protein [Salirhabdus euzebyi]